MTNANTLMKDMVATQKAANKWTKNAYRTANTELYELLAECYAHTQFYRSADISFKLQLNNCCATQSTHSTKAHASKPKWYVWCLVKCSRAQSDAVAVPSTPKFSQQHTKKK